MSEPAWLNKSVQAKIRFLTKRQAEFYYGDPHQARLRGGPLLKEIIQRVQLWLACQASTSTHHCGWMKGLRYYAYSAHDITVMAALAALGRQDAVSGGGLPSYAASILFELWAEDDGSHSIQLLYKDGYRDPNFHPLHVPGCPPLPAPCPLAAFITRSKPFMPWKRRRRVQRTSAATNYHHHHSQASLLRHSSQCLSQQSVLADYKCSLSMRREWFAAAMIVLGVLVSVLLLAVLFFSYKLFNLQQTRTHPRVLSKDFTASPHDFSRRSGLSTASGDLYLFVILPFSQLLSLG